MTTNSNNDEKTLSDTFNLNSIIAYEQGELDDDATIELFQHLVNSGLAWQLQGSYGRTAKSLIDSGYVTLPTGRVSHDYYGNVITKAGTP